MNSNFNNNFKKNEHFSSSETSWSGVVRGLVNGIVVLVF